MSAVGTSPARSQTEAALHYALQLGDSCLVLSQRLAEWVGHAPELEEDLGLANLALDLLGQARHFYTYAGELEGRGRDEDAFAYFRDEHEFRNHLLCEQPNHDFGHALVRQLLFAAYQQELYAALSDSPDRRLAEIAVKALKETRYHLRYAASWVVRLGDGTVESHQRVQQAVTALWPFVTELFTSDAADNAAAGIGPRPETLRSGWQHTIDAVLQEATLVKPTEEWRPLGGKQGRHTEHLGYLLAEMQYLARAHPGTKW